MEDANVAERFVPEGLLARLLHFETEDAVDFFAWQFGRRIAAAPNSRSSRTSLGR